MSSRGISKLTVILIVIICLIGSVSALYTFKLSTLICAGLHHEQSFCNVNEKFNCEVVSTSDYSTFLGVPLGAYGNIFYLSVLVLAVLSLYRKEEKFIFSLKDAFLFATSGSVIYSIYLFLISKLVIESFCLLCMAMYVCNLLMFIIAFFLGKDRHFSERIKCGFFVWLKLPLRTVNSLFVSGNPYRKTAIIGTLGVLFVIGLTAFMPRVFIDWARESQKEIGEEGFHKCTEDPDILDWLKQPESDFVNELVRNEKGFFAYGSVDAPVQVLEFTDIECPYCRRFSVLLDKFKKDYAGKVRVVFRHYPLDEKCNPEITRPFHKNACNAADYSNCAGKQGMFWESMYLLNTLPSISKKESVAAITDEMNLMIESLGIKTEEAGKCLKTGFSRRIVKRHIQEGIVLGVNGTPNVWVNGRRVKRLSGANLKKIFDHLIEHTEKTGS